MNLKNFKIIFLLFIFNFLMPLNVFAKNAISLEASEKDLKSGDEIVVTAKIESDNNLYALTSTLSYDENVFERIDNRNFLAEDNWSDIIYNSSNKKFGLINKSSEISNNMLSFTLKVKDDANVGKTSITLNNISASDGNDIYYFDESSVEVFVTRDASGNEAIINNKNITHIAGNEKDNVIKTVSNKPLMMGILTTACLLIFACILVNVLKVNNQKIITLVLGTLITFSLVILLGFLIVNQNKKDVNDDGVKDYNDAKEIIKYLIDIEGTTDNNLSSDEEESVVENSDQKNTSKNTKTNNKTKNKSKNNNKVSQSYTEKLEENSTHKGDVNNDGVVDIQDVAQSTEDATKKNYKVKLSEIKNAKYYYNKDEEVILEFNAVVEPEEIIKKVVVDGKEYDVVKNTNFYAVNLKAPEVSGEHVFKITQVELDNKRKIDTNLNIKIEVLKTIPEVEHFTVDDESNAIDFILKDNDKAWLNGIIEITNDKEEVLFTGDVNIGDNGFNYNFEKNTLYNVTITGSYDLDSTKGDDNYYTDEIFLSTPIKLVQDYDFKIFNLTVNENINKGENAIITFESTNLSEYIIEKVIINNEEYSVTLMGNNKYQVILPKQDKYGNYEVNIDEVILNNKKSFKNKEDYELNSVTYSVLKSIPSVTILSLTKNENNKTVDVKFKVNDPDNAITKLNAVVIDGNEKIIDSKDVQNLSEITLSYDSLDNVRYVVQFIADYDLGTEDEIYQEKVIGEKDFYLESSIVIVNDKLSTKYPSKGQEIYLYLDIKIPKGFKPSSYPVGITDLITGITINGINYSAQRTKTENDYTKYTVNFIAPNESGVLDLEINRVTFFDGSSYWITPYNSKLEVLKDKPQVENFKIVEENYEKGNVTFKFNINDDNGGFDGGVINLNEQSKEITKGENTVKFDNILTDEIFNLEILGNYDLDSNALDSENNYHQNSKLFSVPYGLFKENYFNTLELNNISVISKNNNVYFEKQEDIKINFEVANLDNINNFDISKIIVMDKEYSVTKNNDNTYSVIVDGFNKAGVKHFNIDEVILNNGKKVTLENPPKISLEVLKDALTINNFNFTATSSEVEVSMKLKDLDNSLVDNQIFIKVYDEDNNLLVSENYQNNFKFSRSNNLLRYYVKVYASYDRDNNTLSEGENSVTDALILNETISFVQNYLEIRDITNVLLYKNINGNASLMDTVNKDDIEKNFQDYFVKISMSNRADFYSNVIRVEEENNHLFLVLDYEYSVIDENGKTQNLRIDFGEIKDGNINNEIRPLTFEELIDAIKTNPDGKFILETDYDASDYITNSNTLIDVDFKGELDGNGHVIKNLYKPIFNNINGGTVKNLNLQNIYLSSNNANGALAIKTNNAIISDILIDNYNKTNSEATTGALIGNATNKTSIENCKVTKLNLSVAGNNQQIGGLIGLLDNSSVKNSYAIGNISGGWNFRGGLVGNIASTSTIENCYAKVTFNSDYGSNSVCGLACVWQGKLIVKNSVSLSSGGISSKLVNKYIEASNNYALDETNIVDGKLNNINKNDVNENLFKERAKFDDSVWNLNSVSFDETPTLKIEYKSALSKNSIKDNELYDENKELLYQNLMKLTPFFDSNTIIENGSLISADNLLNKEEIKHILPIDEDGNLVTYLTDKESQAIKKIIVIFKNQHVETYNVVFDKMYAKVAAYRISGLKLDYTFNHYVIDSDSKLVQNLVKYLSNLDYKKDLDSLTVTEDSRIYRDFYNEVTKGELEEFVLKYLSNSENNLVIESASSNIEKDLKYNDELKKILYVYNYYRRFYDVEFNGIKFYDLVFFNGTGFSNEMNPKNITKLFLSDEKNLGTNRTDDTYKTTLAKFTQQENITRFISYLVKTLTNMTPDAWFKTQFKNILVEVPARGRSDIGYTMWYHLSYEDNTNWRKFQNYALPILTLPENSTYLVSSPTQFLIGSQRTYVKNPDDPIDHAEIQNLVDSEASKIENYFTTASGIIEDANIFNAIHGIQLDQRYTLDSNGNSVYQSRLVTEEEFHKNFNEVIGTWKEMDGNAATSNGTDILWNAHKALLDYSTWSHESAHNIDARLFFKNNGRRFDVGGEDCADSNLSQFWGNGDISMNLTYNFTEEEKANRATNWTLDRINDPVKIHDFYRKVFETIYILDYLEGKAFLQLTPEEQARLAVQAYYPNDPEPENPKENTYKAEYRKRLVTRYVTIDSDKIRDMHLQTIDDLYNNRLVMYPTVIYSTYIDNRYGGENIFKTRWYQPHNDKGRSDSYAIKWFAYEMLGYKGYDKGYIEYYSNINSSREKILNEKNEYVEVDYKTDLMALRNITDNQSMTFETYKKGRFSEVENNLGYIQYIDVNDLFKKFYYALKNDAEVVRLAEEKTYANNDKRNEALSKAREFKESVQIRKEIYYYLKGQTNDFVNEIYDYTKPPKEIEEFKNPEE